ncbi:hypothetical protein OL67_003906 (plasmid) [Phaeobacter piscinae]|nr:hypothetical protein OL67_003906 [Phaeobacter piscinae]
MLNRRAFMTTGLAAASSTLAAPSIAQVASLSGRKVGRDRIWMRRAGIGEEIAIRLQHRTVPEAQAAMAELSWFFRDWKDDDRALWIDPDLIHLISGIQVRASRLHGSERCVMLTSGYRTPERNRTLEGAALNSFHLKGQAGDIYFSGFNSRQVAHMARLSGAGGVGTYTRSGFTHVDTGPRRNWGS